MGKLLPSRRRQVRTGWLTLGRAQFSLFLVLTFVAALCLGVASLLKLRYLRLDGWKNTLVNPENAVRGAVERYLRYFGVGQPIDNMDASFANTMSIHTEIYHTKLAQHSGFPEEGLWEEEFYAGDRPPAEADVQRENAALLEKLDGLIRKAHQVVPKQGTLAFASPMGHYGTLTKGIAKGQGQICPSIYPEDYETFDSRRRVLFILGTQKGGTTYLFDALTRSKHFVGALHSYGYVGQVGLQSYAQVGVPPDWPKEVHFFNRFPQPKSPRREYLKSFPRSTWLLDKSSQERANYTLVDATPDYMFNSMAPPRVKIMFPQAKFVVLLRDPVARSLAEYLGAKALYCDKLYKKYPSKVCDFPSFAEVVTAELEVRATTPGCLFNEPGGDKAWPDCFKCSFSAVDSNFCNPADGTQLAEACTAPPYTTVDVGNFAAQMSWWFSFFPPDRFKFVLSQELRSKRVSKRVDVLNSIVDFVGLQGYARFTEDMLVNVTGRATPASNTTLSEADHKALLALRLTYRQSLLDLATLMRHNHIQVKPIHEEHRLMELRAYLPKDIIAQRPKASRGGAAAAGTLKRPKPPSSRASLPSPTLPSPRPSPRQSLRPGMREYTDAKLDEILAYYAAKPVDASRYAFQKPNYAALSRRDEKHMCPEIFDEAPYPVLSDKRKVLFILGAQKGGTTFLFSALTTHPNFVGAEHGFRQPHTEWAKEVHFFNRWPTPRNARTVYMSCFPRETWMLGANYSEYTLVDGTPDYMFNAMAAPRIKEMVPQAKFVVLLRDPVTRAYSAYRMSQKMACRMQNKTNPGVPCKFPTFAEVVVAESSVRRTKNCLFDVPGSGKTWGDCFRCHFSHLSKEHCPANVTEGETLPAPCTASSFITLDVGNYAAQLAWWLSFFPPDRFLVLLSSDLHSPDVAVRVNVLNRVKNFATVAGPDFNASALDGARDFSGGYDLSAVRVDDLKALMALRLIYRQSLLDLKLMLWKTGRHKDFPGVGEDISAAALAARLEEQQAIDRAQSPPSHILSADELAVPSPMPAQPAANATFAPSPSPRAVTTASSAPLSVSDEVPQESSARPVELDMSANGAAVVESLAAPPPTAASTL